MDRASKESRKCVKRPTIYDYLRVLAVCSRPSTNLGHVFAVTRLALESSQLFDANISKTFRLEMATWLQWTTNRK